MCKNDFDLIVIGSGPAGSAVANTCAGKGLKVAVADQLFGGTCALRGCTPKKAMESVTSLYWQASHLAGHGFTAPEPICWKHLLTHKQAFTTQVPGETKESFREAGIEVIEASVHFTGKNTLSNGQTTYQANNIVIATGATPRPLDITGAKHLLTNSDFFELSELPQHLLFVGGGYIGFELSHIAAACGSEVTIVSNEQKPLNSFDPDLVTQFVKATLDKSIDVRLGFEVKKIEKKGKKYLVTISRLEHKKEIIMEVDGVVHSAGRIPNIAHLNLKKAGIKFTDKGIKVNDKLQCQGNPKVYAVGDVNGKFPFTPVGSYEGEIASHNILHKGKKKVSHKLIPYTLFGYPKIASIGQSEKQLKDSGIEYEKIQADASGWLMEKSYHNDFAGHKILKQKKGGKILGAHLLGSKADELINLFAIVMQNNLTADQIKKWHLAYPTVGSWLPSLVS